MSDIRARMAEVLLRELPSFGWRDADRKHIAAHVADVLAEQLGLTQEWAVEAAGTSCRFESLEYAGEFVDDIRRNPRAPDKNPRVVTWWTTKRFPAETGGAR